MSNFVDSEFSPPPQLGSTCPVQSVHAGDVWSTKKIINYFWILEDYIRIIVLRQLAPLIDLSCLGFADTNINIQYRGVLPTILCQITNFPYLLQD